MLVFGVFIGYGTPCFLSGAYFKKLEFMYIPFRIKRSEDRQYYFVIVAKNGQVLATSETYTRKANCKKALKIFPKMAETASINLFIDETL